MTALDQLLTMSLRLERQALRAEHVGTSRWYASGASDCWRKRWYQATGADPDPEQEPDGRSILSMDHGSWTHERVQAVLGALPGVECEVGWRVSTLGIGGRADLVLREPIKGLCEVVPAVGEIKVMSDYGFRVAEKCDSPERRHVVQASYSALMLECSWVLIIYISRDSFRTRAWLLGADVRTATDEIQTIERLEGSGVMPHRVIPGEDRPVADPLSRNAPWQCRYCPYRTTCGKAGA